jgi:hypothetical protein
MFCTPSEKERCDGRGGKTGNRGRKRMREKRQTGVDEFVPDDGDELVTVAGRCQSAERSRGPQELVALSAVVVLHVFADDVTVLGDVQNVVQQQLVIRLLFVDLRKEGAGREIEKRIEAKDGRQGSRRQRQTADHE